MGGEKYQVLVPQPQHHSFGSTSLQFRNEHLESLKKAAQKAGSETMDIVQAQFFSRLPTTGDDTLCKNHPACSHLTPLDGLCCPVADGTRLACCDEHASTGIEFEVEFLHKLSAWKGLESWEPIRQRNESYGLFLEDGKLVIDAQSSWGLSNAMSTLYQLLEIKHTKGNWVMSVPRCPHQIADAPAFPHRGILVDTSRTFYPVKWLKEIIAQVAQFKLNILHLHLTDTAAWSFAVEGHPELVAELSYRTINDEELFYTREDVKDLVEFARLRGVSLLPEVDGPVHAPTAASGEPLQLTVAAGIDVTLDDYGAEPPVATWNFSSSRVTGLLKNVFTQLDADFSTAPFIHAGGDEPKAAAVCAALDDQTAVEECTKQCTTGGLGPYHPSCKPAPVKPADAPETYWFPEVLNAKIQHYFDSVLPGDAQKPTAVWSGVREDMAVTLPSPSKAALQLWEFPQPGAKGWSLTEDDCKHYDLIQSSATHPLANDAKFSAYSDEGWMYLECGEAQNWISMGKFYWCNRASWVTLYSLNITRHSSPVLETPSCQDAFIGAEIAIWGEVTGPGNALSLIFPRAAAFAERVWTNPPALNWEDLHPGTGDPSWDKAGVPPKKYWDEHLKGALHRLNTVVENFVLQGVQTARLQPKFCFDHPDFCDHYTVPFLYEPTDELTIV